MPDAPENTQTVSEQDPRERMMADQKLRYAVEAEIQDSLGWMGSKLSNARRQALDYYFGEPFGNEKEGRSSIVLTDVLDTIEWIMPSLLRIFTSGDEVVKFEPQGPEDEPVADQATDYCNWIMMRDNPGFMILYQLFKDALLEKLGVGKAYWDEQVYAEAEMYLGLSDDEMHVLIEDPDVEVLQHTGHPLPQVQPPPVPVPQGVVIPPPQDLGGIHDVLIRRVRQRVKIENCPPEEFLLSRDARSFDDARFLAHRSRKTASDLVKLGVPKDVVDNLPYGGWADELNQERLARHNPDDAAVFTMTQREGASRIIWTTESYIRIDYDGDGVTELRRVVTAGDNAQTILFNDAVEDHPFFGVTPIIIPHKVIGLSMADLTMKFQLLRSTLVRQFLDNLYFTTNGRWGVVEGRVNLDDVLNSVPGGVVRMDDPGAMFPLAPPPIGQAVLPMMEFLAGERENATGITKYNQGGDANTLNKTATGISAIMSASQARVELIARIFAETGVKELFRKILRLVVKHQNKARILRLRNEWVPMDPSEWNTEMDLSINVGIGTGSREQIAANAMNIMTLQERMAQAGLGGTIVTPENIYKAAKSYIQNTGFKGDGGFFTDPATAPPKGPPPPDPALLKLEQDGHVAMAKLALERDKMLLEHHAKLASLHLQHGHAPPPPPDLATTAGPPQSPAPMPPGMPQ